MTTSTKFLAEKIARAERNWNGPKWQGQRNMLKPTTVDSTETAAIPSEPMSATAGGVMKDNSNYSSKWYRTDNKNQWERKTTDVVTSTGERDKPTSTGLHYDEGKSRVDLLDPDFLLAVGKVLGFGCNKYNDHNWRGGIPISKLIGSCLRHLFAVNRGEDIDSESGLPHTAHLGCDSMFLHWTLKYRSDLDDRYKY